MQQRFRGPDIRPLTNQSRGQADRQILRQLQLIQVECGNLRFAGQCPRKNRQLIACPGKIPLQRRQQGLCLRHLGSLRKDVGKRDTAYFRSGFRQFGEVAAERAMISCVACNCARNEASFTVVVTILEARVR